MNIYIVSLAAGALVGVIYALMGVRSPAPPLVALVGLLGILVGEQSVSQARRLLHADQKPPAEGQRDGQASSSTESKR